MSRGKLVHLVLLAAVWGVSWPAMRTAAPAIGATGTAWSRMVFAVATLLVFALVSDRPALRPGPLLRYLPLTLFNAAIPLVLTPLALTHLTASYGSVLNAGTPLFSALFASLLLGQEIRREQLLGMVGGIVGVAIVMGLSPIPIDATTLLSIGAIMTGSVCYAFAAVWARREFSGESGMRVAVWQQIVALAILSPLALVFNPGAPDELDTRWTVALAIVVLGVVCTAIGYLQYFALIREIGPTMTATVTILIPIFGLIWSALLLGESVTAGSMVGMVIVLASVWVVIGRPNLLATARATGG